MLRDDTGVEPIWHAWDNSEPLTYLIMMHGNMLYALLCIAMLKQNSVRLTVCCIVWVVDVGCCDWRTVACLLCLMSVEIVYAIRCVSVKLHTQLYTTSNIHTHAQYDYEKLNILIGWPTINGCELQMWTYAGSNKWTFFIALTLCSASFCYICIGYVVLPSPLAMVQPLQALECETEREWNFVIQYTCFNTFVT